MDEGTKAQGRWRQSVANENPLFAQKQSFVCQQPMPDPDLAAFKEAFDLHDEEATGEWLVLFFSPAVDPFRTEIVHLLTYSVSGPLLGIGTKRLTATRSR